MWHDDSYSMLDKPEILQFIFYPRRDTRTGPANSTDYFIKMKDGVSIGCRFYVHNNSSPTILFFHGNGEVVSDYDSIAPFYNKQGINLFVADYRGYGSSGGTPSFASMAADAHSIFDAFQNILLNDHFTGDAFVMGRSLGSMSAIELAFSYQEKLKGLIIESGFASIVRLLERIGFPAEFVGITGFAFPNLVKIKSIALPTLILHGEYDSIIPVTEAEDLFQNAAAKNKRLLIINNADHNDIMLVGMETYFKAIKDFIYGF